MAAQIADRSNAGMNFNNGNEDAPVVSKLEATRLALAQEQKKRIDAAVARVTSKKESGKRKGQGERTDTGHRSKKSKTVVDVANDQLDKKNSIARRMVNRFATMPEPEHEEAAEPEQQPVTRSVSAQQFVTHPTSVKATSPLDTSQRMSTEKVTPTTKATTVKEKEADAAKSESEEEAPAEEEQEKQKSEWDGPTTNFHVKQLGLDDKVDIYAPIAQQEDDVQRIRERAKYMPSGDSTMPLNTSCDSEAALDFLPEEVPSQESKESDALLLDDTDASESQAHAEEMEEFEQQTAIETAEVCQTWAKRVFVFTPLFVLAIIALVFALLFAIDWSQETFQFCKMDAESAESAEDIFSCASFVETQSLIKSTLRETADKVQETVQSYFE